MGEICLLCDDPIEADHQGGFTIYADWGKSEVRAVHAWCQLRSVAGSIGHLLKLCTCFLPADDENAFHDPPGLSRQEAALEVWNYIRSGGAPA